ncbi:MAG TPA: cell wall hydrolase [Rhizomicrobium sp.]
MEYVQNKSQPVQISVQAVPGDAARAELLAEHRCLSEVMYYEARGEGPRGEMAVAEVVFHRLESSMHGKSICAVVYEGAGRPVCQFSFVCDGSLSRVKEALTWRTAQDLATRILTGALPLPDATDGALNYHAVYVRPVWAGDLVRTAQIGNHIFYRPPGGENIVLRARAFRGSVW